MNHLPIRIFLTIVIVAAASVLVYLIWTMPGEAKWEEVEPYPFTIEDYKEICGDKFKWVEELEDEIFIATCSGVEGMKWERISAIYVNKRYY